MLTCWDNEETAFENAQHWRKNTVREGRGEGLEALRGIHTIRAQSEGTFSNQWDFSQWIHPIFKLACEPFH